MLRVATESLIRLVKAQLDADAVLVPVDDIFEIPKKLPSVVLQGPTPEEDRLRRTMAAVVTKDLTANTFTSGQAPRLYHLDFDIIVTAGNEGDLLDMMARVAVWYQRFTELSLPEDGGKLNLTELVPVGGLKRVNLSNLKQASGRCRIEDCPLVGDGQLVGETSGKLVTKPPRIEVSLG